MAVIKKDFSYMEFPLSISRQDAFPLDKSSIWFDYTEAETYAKTSPLAYPGQIIAVVDEDGSTVDTYKIEIDGSLSAVGGGASAIIKSTNPATSDWDYEIGQMWINSSDNTTWFLVATSDSNGQWRKMVTPDMIENLGGGDMLASKYATIDAPNGYVDKSQTAKKLETPRAISVSGDATGTVDFDGSAPVDIAITLKNTGTEGTYYKVTTDAQGRVISGTTTLAKSDISDLGVIGTAAAKDAGTAEGNVPVLGAEGKLDKTLLPTLSNNDISGLGDVATKSVASNSGDVADSGKVPVLGAEGKLDVNVIPSLTVDKISNIGTAASANIGTGQGNVPVLDSNGKLNTSVIPSLALMDVTTVATKDELTTQGANVQKGDITIVTEESKTYILAADDSTQAENWKEIITPTDGVISVNGETGAVTLTTDDIDEGSRMYYTDERANTNFSTNWGQKTTTDLTEGTNLYYTDDRFDTRFGQKTTTDLTEGTNLYYTEARAETAIKNFFANNTFIINGPNAAGTYDESDE